MRISRLNLWVVVGAVLLFGACGDDDGPEGTENEEQNANTHTPSDDNEGTDNGENEVTDNIGFNENANTYSPPPPIFEPRNLSFEPTEPGTQATKVGKLVNHDDQVITIDAVVFDGSAFSLDPEIGDWPEELNPGESIEIEVTYHPETAEEHTGELEIEWTAEYGNTTTVRFEGNQACIEAEPTYLDFSDVDLGASKELSTTVTNCGFTDYEITTRIAFFRTPNSPPTLDAPEHEPFSVVNDDSTALALAAGESLEIEVEYAPSVEPVWEFSLQLTTNAASGPRVMVELDHGVDTGDLPDCDEADTNQYEHC